MSDVKICIVGLGYVGLPLAVEFGKKFKTVGIDVIPERIIELENGYDRTLEVSKENLKASTGLSYSIDILDAKDCNFYIVTVPTPINKNNMPDLTPVEKSSQSVGRVLAKENIVIYESTVYPGVTEEFCVPILEKVSGLKFNEDFYCGYSPERINPGDKKHTVANILKITSGSTPEVAKKVDALYNTIITAGTYLAPTIKTAEAAKVIENTQRDVNIALINELALIFDTMGIDTQAVLDAAGTKWNFLKFSPGLVGGHCIGVDPYYLTYKAEELGYKPNLILSSRQINNGMGKYIAEKTVKLMIKANKAVKNANILILGLTFKENCPDVRNTRVVDIMGELKEYGCQIDIHDPWIDQAEVMHEYGLNVEKDFKNLDPSKYDAVIYAVSHNEFKSLKSEIFTNATIVDVKGIADRADWKL